MKTDDSFTITTKQQKQITAFKASLLQKVTEGEHAKSYIDAVIKVRDPSTSLGMTNPVVHTMADRRGRRSLRWHLISIKHSLAIHTFAKQIHDCKRQTENLKKALLCGTLRKEGAKEHHKRCSFRCKHEPEKTAGTKGIPPTRKKVRFLKKYTM